jgi:integrase
MHKNTPATVPMPTDDWDSAYALAVETMERLKQQPVKVIALEIDRVEVWRAAPPAAVIDPDTQVEVAPSRGQARRMVSATLMGSHTHTTLTGVEVHVWIRRNTYLARGRVEGRSFGETLGSDASEATARLRQILTEIEHGSFLRPSESRKRKVGGGRTPRLTVRQLISAFIAAKRKQRGRQTATDYGSRLRPVLDFAEQPAGKKRWPLAADIDRDFVLALKSFLAQYTTTRNGRAGGTPKLLSSRQAVNVLECLRAMLAWARDPRVNRLPAEWVMPLTHELVGTPPAKDPFREDKLPLQIRAGMVGHMDRWQLCQLSLSLVLPLRPDEAAGLLVGDVNFGEGWLEFGERLRECNFTKGRTAFKVPFPDEMRCVLRACIGDRAEGPLLRSRAAFEGSRQAESIESLEHLTRLYQEELLRQPSGAVQADHDRKSLFRGLLRRLGGVAEDAMNKEVKKVLAALGVSNGATLYTLRSSVTTAMHRANLPHLEMRYLTGHTTSDILNESVTLDPVGAMRQYFGTIRPLLKTIADRARELGLADA